MKTKPQKRVAGMFGVKATVIAALAAAGGPAGTVEAQPAVRQADVPALHEQPQSFAERFRVEHAAAEVGIRPQGIAKLSTDGPGDRTGRLLYIVNGRRVYDTTDNAYAADFASTDEILLGGSSGFDPDGTGADPPIRDGGHPLVELGTSAWAVFDVNANTEDGDGRVKSYAPPATTQVPTNVAIFQNFDPWGALANQDTLTANGIAFTIFTSADMGVVSLAPFDKVIISSLQSRAFYVTVGATRAWFEGYVAAGGILDLHVAAFSGASDIGGIVLPGGFITNFLRLTDDVTIVDPTHPVLTTPNVIVGADLDNWNSSARSTFAILPSGAIEIIEDAFSGDPVAMDLNFGAGRIFATTQDVESNAHPGYLENTILYGASVASTPVGQTIKNRYLSFSAGDPGLLQAVLVTFVTLPGSASQYNTTTAWVDVPKLVGPGPQAFMSAELSDTPVFLFWSTFGLVHVHDEERIPPDEDRIVPSLKPPGLPLEPATYEIQVVSPAGISPPLTITNPRWGDIAGLAFGNFVAPDGDVTVADILGMLASFSSNLGAPSIPQADLIGVSGGGPTAAVDHRITVSDLLGLLGAFAGNPYPYY